ncbi:LysR family transcriptional regulator [Rhodovastum atsumiense]|uniref:LysR family transcriptional regulator n=1 Tax=Rhodovastum atsumiense TaxID=504468 RepID=A0A5M6IM31_9PROT|nr:LysR family transcriptional regulator [Rhodovastum atsumiense]KAA5609300.1 LysR family transcriptional regulator [Rhodovastum atsumiense]CAH2604605.1 LysR family transcriptional regulator [Rhodovastum atsumiense]
MDLLIAMRTFVRVAETGSFSAVAREIGATQPAVSRQIAALEEHLAARLLQRSTRSLTLTEDGRDLLAHARFVLEAVEQAEAAIGRRRASPAGLVRLGSPTVFGRMYVAPRIGLLLARYPELSVELVMADDVVDMVQEGLDLTLRVGSVADPTLVARRVGVTTSQAVAAPAYLDRHGEPRHPSDLAGHDCIIFTRGPTPETWNFTGAEETVPVAVHGRLRVNSIEAALEAALAGVGVALVPTWMLREELREGRLRPLLQAWRPPHRPISLVYPSRRFLAPRTRTVIDFIVDEFRLDPVISAYGVA